MSWAMTQFGPRIKPIKYPTPSGYCTWYASILIILHSCTLFYLKDLISNPYSIELQTIFYEYQTKIIKLNTSFVSPYRQIPSVSPQSYRYIFNNQKMCFCQKSHYLQITQTSSKNSSWSVGSTNIMIYILYYTQPTLHFKES